MDKDKFDDDYQEYLDWCEYYEVPDDGQATVFMFIMFWWVPVLPVLLFSDWIGLI